MFLHFLFVLRRKTRASFNQYSHMHAGHGTALRVRYSRSCRRAADILLINNFLNVANSTIMPLRWDIIHRCVPRGKNGLTRNKCPLNTIAARCLRTIVLISMKSRSYVGVGSTQLFYAQDCSSYYARPL